MLNNKDPDSFSRRPQNIEEVANLYDRWAFVYHMECENGFMDYQAPLILSETVLKAIPDTSKIKTILDAGAGTGYSLQLLRPHFKNSHRTALDLSEKMLEKCQKNGLADVCLQTNLDGKKWPVEDEISDLVISVGVTGLIADMPNFMSEAARNLKTGGILAMTFLRHNIGKNSSLRVDKIKEYPRHHFEIETLAQQSGLEKIGDFPDFIGYSAAQMQQSFGLFLGRKL